MPDSQPASQRCPPALARQQPAPGAWQQAAVAAAKVKREKRNAPCVILTALANTTKLALPLKALPPAWPQQSGPALSSSPSK